VPVPVAGDAAWQNAWQPAAPDAVLDAAHQLHELVAVEEALQVSSVVSASQEVGAGVTVGGVTQAEAWPSAHTYVDVDPEFRVQVLEVAHTHARLAVAGT